MVKHLMAIFLCFWVSENEHHFSLFSSRGLFHESLYARQEPWYKNKTKAQKWQKYSIIATLKL